MSTQVSVPASAVLSGCFLSGAMMGLSLMAVPVLLETNTQAGHLVDQWFNLYQHGHHVAPAMSIATLAVYLWTAVDRRSKHKPWLVFLLAGLITFTMVPFTLTLMAPTNNALFKIEHDKNSMSLLPATLAEVQQLVIQWQRFHAVRSLFPLAGTIVGLTGTLNELKILK
ncbi:hypothetical protein AMS68_004774 [Peltaster fructicola]|uniref:DUF1772 domain-containing protein n=1 Tax=Peltaster fructicola TaxID=286661 RepID=A0A6H0XWW2_9PEZI|nr:hypothetical protein AMS68_004774 [Peltaster fructicola]